LNDSEKLKHSLTNFYQTIALYLNEVFPELTYANIMFVDVPSMKVIRWHTASDDGAEVFIKNEKVTRLYEKIIDRQQVNDFEISLFNQDGLINEPLRRYVVIDVMHKILPFEDPSKLVENVMTS
jgi:hypothetical protein